jgi:L-serine dehydratase
VVPAVVRYYRDHGVGATDAGIRDLLLVAAAEAALRYAATVSISCRSVIACK